MLATIKEYTKLDKSIINLITVEFFVQIINVSFVAILPLYMKLEGYSDAEYAHFTSYRYFGMLALALFLGMYLKGRKILTMIYIASTGVPLFALLILVGVQIHSNSLLLIAHLLWGIAYTFIQIPILPYIMRNAPKAQQTLAITLNFATWSIATITGSLAIAVLNGLNKIVFSEHNLLFSIAAMGFTGVYFVFKMNKNEHVPLINEKRSDLKKYDWKIIIRALIPTTVIAIGAGFTNPIHEFVFFKRAQYEYSSLFSIKFRYSCFSYNCCHIYSEN